MGIEHSETRSSFKGLLFNSLDVKKSGGDTYSMTTVLQDQPVHGIEENAINFMIGKISLLSNNKKAYISNAGGGHNICIGDEIYLSSFIAEHPTVFDPDKKRCSKTLFQGIVDTCRTKFSMFSNS